MDVTVQLLHDQSELIQQVLALNSEIVSRLSKQPSRSYLSGSVLPHIFPACCLEPEQNRSTYIDTVERTRVSAESSWSAQESNLSEPFLRHSSFLKCQDRENYTSYFFPQVEEMKHTVSQYLKAKKYNVEDFYKESGLCQAIARSEYFKSLAMIVIAINTVWIAIETDYNKAPILCEAPLAFQIGDNAFCACFTLEILIRFMAFQKKSNVFNDGWFMFDAFLVILMCWETWILVAIYMLLGINIRGFGEASNLLRLVRLIRLVRVARAARLLHAVPEMLILAKGIFAAVRSVLAVMFLLSLVIYVFAILMTQLLSGTVAGAGIFDRVPQALNSLLLAVLCGPDPVMLDKLLAGSLLWYLLFIAFVLLAQFTILNMLIAILCGVVSEVSQQDKEEALEADLEIEITRFAKMIDSDSTGTINKKEFDSILKDPEMTYNFICLGVDIVSASDFAKHIFDYMDEISFSDFRHLVAQFRRDKGVTGKDIADMRKFISMEMVWLEARLQKGMASENSLLKL